MKQNGFVGFFDILGYQNIVLNNDIDKVAEIITNIILELPSIVKKDVKDTLARLSEQVENKPIVESLIKNFKKIDFLIFSDSILITLPIEESIYLNFPVFHWMTFLIYCTTFLDKTFNNGLPVRGAIDYGEYYIKKNCFAGKPIIEGYELSNRLEFSGCVLCKRAEEEIKPFVDSNLINSFVVKYLSPLKNNSEESLFLLNWVNHGSEKSFDLRQSLFNAFHAHNKVIPDSALNKLNNTEKIIRYFILNDEIRDKKRRV